MTVLYTGKERDAETGLDFFGARYFSAAQGRFTSPDWSAVPQPIPYADLSDPQTLNLYSSSAEGVTRHPYPSATGMETATPILRSRAPRRTRFQSYTEKAMGRFCLSRSISPALVLPGSWLGDFTKNGKLDLAVIDNATTIALLTNTAP